MKCPYREFQECIVEQCPACNYKEVYKEGTIGKYPAYMTREKALEEGYIRKDIKLVYEFVSCKLIDDRVQPVPAKKEVVNNNHTKVVVKQSLF